MASLTSSAVTIPNFSGLKASATATRSTVSTVAVPKTNSMAVKASIKDFATAVVATAATAIFATSAMAAEIDVLLGGPQGELAFVPSTVEAKAGDTIVFKNNTGYPHNVLFDEDEVPAGVDVAKISMDENDLLNAPGETYKVVLKEPGSYSVYCSPHQGAGMVGKVVIN